MNASGNETLSQPLLPEIEGQAKFDDLRLKLIQYYGEISGKRDFADMGELPSNNDESVALASLLHGIKIGIASSPIDDEKYSALKKVRSLLTMDFSEFNLMRLEKESENLDLLSSKT